MAASLPHIGVTRQHGDIHSGAVPVDQVQIVPGIGTVDAALPGQDRGDTHTQHAGKDGGGIIPHQMTVRPHRVLMHVDIHKAGSHDPARGINDLIRLRLALSDSRHPAVLQQQV